ncbi:response regulator [Segetibacter aerophilus]|uniref:Response regulator n=1 Tax=Segetibacter aerophilus TaxID=670293 RepID=A0A512BH51_9BACT|nr:response regulator [Segetibacter aerophilus]GEO11308.1 response regulator [Segetibacter aerophilus]
MRKTSTILIVDDDEDDKEMFLEIVAELQADIKCLKAGNGFEALEVLKKEALLPDFVFLDLNMPRMNGRQCLEQLKKDANFKKIPVIIYTTSRLEEDKEQTKKLGAVHFISKPSSLIALRIELEKVFSKEWI